MFVSHRRIPACFALALLVGCDGVEEATSTWTARAVRSELLLGPPTWVVDAAGKGAPEVGLAAPSSALAVDKQSLPSLLLAAGSSVSFALDPASPSPGSRWRLMGALGADGATWGQLDGAPGSTLQLEILVDGTTRAAATLASGVDRGWQHLIGDDGVSGLSIEIGAEVSLRCGSAGESLDLDIVRGAFARLAWLEERDVPMVAATPEAPNVVLVVVDTLRADHVSAYGYERRTTPRLKNLAARGALFEQAYATSSWTWPSTASIFTGLTPAAHGVTSSRTSYLHGEFDTLAEQMAFGGLRTAAFVGNPLIVPQQNFDQGFEVFRHTTAGAMVDSPTLIPEAINWLDEHGDERFFLYLHPVDPHEPHDYPPLAEKLFPGTKPRGYPKNGLVALRGRALRGQTTFMPDGRSRLRESISDERIAWATTTYDRAIWTADRWFGRLLDALEVRGLTDRTVIAFTSDHGEELLDHGAVLHGHTLYEEVVHIPLVLAGPGVPVGQRFAQPVSNRALGATLASLAGLPGNGGEAALLWDASPSVLRYANSAGHWHDREQVGQLGLRRGRWSLIHAINGSAWGAEPAPLEQVDPARTVLFDLSSDPTQQNDLSAEYPALVTELLEVLFAAEAADAARALPTLGDAGADTLNMLRGMGYLDDEE